MTKGNFTHALSKLDSTYISESLCYTKRDKAIRNGVVTEFGIIAVTICVVIVFATILSFALYASNTTDDGIDSSSEIGEYLMIAPETSGKISSGHKIGIKCLSFCTEKMMNIDVFMSQLLLDRERNSISGYPVFEVFQVTENDIESGSVLINQNSGDYERRFGLEDLNFLVSNSIEDDVFDGHIENVTLDFSRMKPGDTIAITFSYGFFYYEDNPYNQFQRDNSWCGMRVSLYFYCGEKGISVSSNCIEDAISEYEKCSEKIIEVGHNPKENIICKVIKRNLQTYPQKMIC